ncbi:MAG: hypothetical protein GWP91_20085 [Rhodobacterales bacterium]|nr:hypothetical protein [Rhodobacterales bacterium]
MSNRKGGLPDGSAYITLGELTPPPLKPVSELIVPLRPPLSTEHFDLAIRNLCFEGGGSKGIAYCGALKVLEEAGVYPNHIHRVAGTSSGSLFAVLVAVGFTADELRDLLYDTDLVALMRDARFGRMSELFNLFTIYGFNPGFRLMEWLGDLLEQRVGAADVTFKQLYERCGRELCIPITNITRMMTEYCHPKTTPDMPVRLAVGMSMSLPVLMQPYKILRRMGRSGKAEEDLYTDGGLLCNYPLHAFDGWWLSLKPEDTYLKRIRPLKDVARFMHAAERFHPVNHQTLGFTVFDGKELDITASWQHESGGPPPRPDTTLAGSRAAAEAGEAELSALSHELESAFERLMEALDAVEKDGDGRVSRDEIAGLFDCGTLCTRDAELLFGSSDLQEIFLRLDRNQDGQVSYDELLKFMDANSLDLTARALGTRRTESSSVTGFMSNVFNTMLVHIRRSSLRHEDRGRTVPIDTDYIGTADFDLEDGDRAFLLETGARATRAVLGQYRSEVAK